MINITDFGKTGIRRVWQLLQPFHLWRILECREYFHAGITFTCSIRCYNLAHITVIPSREKRQICLNFHEVWETTEVLGNFQKLVKPPFQDFKRLEDVHGKIIFKSINRPNNVSIISIISIIFTNKSSKYSNTKDFVSFSTNFR